MNAKTRKRMMLVAVLIFCLCSFEQPVSAQSKCHKVTGTAIDTIAGGTLTQAGILNGTTQFGFTSGFLPAPVATAVSFTADYTVTTHKGVLKTHSVYIYDFARRLAAAISQIDPVASTGVFAGATGTLYFNSQSTDGGVTVQSDIAGEICLAHDDDGND
jgi:hypothetical protein